ncbi:site-specific DNA-methyltransferase [Corynebacterium casei]|uniref:site-specific DNA-methyltransferase n=1 Tax=Corynebacterium casei TaxID=160386 RepID=UPI003FD3BE43
MNDDINHIPSSTPGFQTELAEKLAELAPEAIADGKIDVEKLKELLNGDADESNERFGLFWPGKRRALRAAQQPTTATLKPDVENSKDWDTTKNVFIEGDNLEVLKVLQKHYHGKVKMIYIDPPYNTGKDFVYPDNYKEGLETYLEWTKQVNEDGRKVSTNSEAEGRYHSNWLNMMYPRLKLARNLLTPDGVMAVHIDEHEHSNLEKLLNELFGENCNLGTIVWDKRNPKGDSTGVAQQHEIIMMYCRNRKVFKQIGDFTRPKANAQEMFAAAAKATSDAGGVNAQARKAYKDWVKSQPSLSGGESAYSQLDDEGQIYRTVSMAWPNKNRAPDDYFIPLIHPVTGKECPVPARGWRNPPSTMKTLLDSGKIVFGIDESVQPTRKYLLKDNMYENVASVMYHAGSDDELLSSLGIPFDTPKPIKVSSRLIQAATRSGDIILDFFSGSATTAHAVMELNAMDGGNRCHIQVQLPEPTPEKSAANRAGFGTVAELSRERIRRAGEKLEKDLAEEITNRNTSIDVGFRTYKLSDTNFSKWQVSSDTPVNELEQHLLELRESANDSAAPADLFVELLLKKGYSLTEDIGDVSIAGLDLKTVLDVEGDVAVLAYLDEHAKPTLDQLREIADSKPVRFVILEDCFQGDDELKTNLVQICKTSGVELWTA